MKILGLLPARGGSKGVPRKNCKLLQGKPLIVYTIESALACPLIDQVLVSTEDAEIARISKAAGAQVPFLRPAELATDTSPTIDTVVHVLEYLQSKNIFFDAICLLQPTVPFRDGKDLYAAIQKFIDQEVDCLISVREVPPIYNPHWVYEVEATTGFLKMAMDENIIGRRQDLPQAFHRDGSVYLTKTEVVLQQRSLYGKKITHHVMAASPNINIDTIEDWEAATAFAKENLKKTDA